MVQCGYPDIQATTAECRGGAVRPQTLQLKRGKRYELRVSAPVRVKPGQGQPLPTDLTVTPDESLCFFATVDTLQLLAATTSDAIAWLREVLE